MTMGSRDDHPAGETSPPLTVRGIPVDPSLRIMAGVGLLLVRSVWTLVAAMVVIEVFDSGGRAVRSGSIARLAEGGRAVQFKAYLRAMTNVGIFFGAMLGGLALLLNRDWAYSPSS